MDLRTAGVTGIRRGGLDGGRIGEGFGFGGFAAVIVDELELVDGMWWSWELDERDEHTPQTAEQYEWLDILSATYLPHLQDELGLRSIWPHSIHVSSTFNRTTTTTHLTWIQIDPTLKIWSG